MTPGCRPTLAPGGPMEARVVSVSSHDAVALGGAAVIPSGLGASKPGHAEVLLRLLFFFSGVAAPVYQKLWVRLLALGFGTSAFAVSTVLAVFFSGLALGSAVIGRAVDRARRPLRWFA